MKFWEFKKPPFPLYSTIPPISLPNTSYLSTPPWLFRYGVQVCVEKICDVENQT